MSSNPAETCWTVLNAAAGGDTAARSAFAQTYLPVIRGFFELRWRDRLLAADVEDATQEVFVECLKSGGVLEGADARRGDFRGLLFGVTRNVARRFEARAAERGRLRPEDSAWVERLAAGGAGQETEFDRGWARALVREATELHRRNAAAEGPEGRRRIELLDRRFGDDEPIRKIAADWGVDAQRVHNAYKKARIEFYGCLREVVARHLPAAADVASECQRLLRLLG